MKHFRLLSILPLLFLIIASCRTNESPTNTDGNKDGTITTTIAGVVNDENGLPIQDADITVSLNGIVKSSAKTNKYGSFMILNANVPSSRCFILCKKNGYFTGSRAEIPNAGKITEMRLTLQSDVVTHTVSANSGGKITVGTASISFPSNAFVTSLGSTYTGIVNIAAKFLDPTAQTFYDSFSGDMTGSRSDGSQTELLSYGVLRVQIKDASGKELKLASGKKATLSYPLAASMQKDAPVSMPLWYFDDVLGMWKEEGTAVKTGNVYSGEVEHFSDWNCDDPMKSGTIRGRIVCDGNQGVSGIYVTVGERKTITDSNGYFSCIVPAGINILITINQKANMGFTVPDVSVTPLTGKENRALPDIQLTGCPVTITGTIVDCNSVPTEGVAVIVTGGSYYCCFTSSGIFKARVAPSITMTVEVTTYKGETASSVAVPPVNSGGFYSTGAIAACGNAPATEFLDINLDKGQTSSSLFSPDGSLLVVQGIYSTSSGVYDRYFYVEVFDVKTGIRLCTFSKKELYFGNFSADGSKLLLLWDLDSTCIVNPVTGAIIQEFKTPYGGSEAKLTPNGSAVVSLTSDSKNTIWVYSVADGSLIRKFATEASVDELFLVGLKEPNQIQLIDCGSKSKSTHITSWDYTTGSKTADLKYPNLFTYYNLEGSAGFSSNGMIAGLQDFPNGKAISFYNTVTGKEINSSPFIVPDREKFEKFYIGTANDSTFVVQSKPTISYKETPPPTIFTILGGKTKKVLPVSSKNMSYTDFQFSPDSRYLAGVEEYYANNYPNNTIRIWKLK